jgi:hypothetical protein
MPRAKQPNPANTRTDLLTPGAPGRAMEAPDQAYGRATAQAQSQKILPIGPQAAAPTPPAASGSPPAATNPGALPPGGIPGDPGPAHTWLPSNPGAPFTTGMATGPGAGPEALQGEAANFHALTQTAPSETNTLRTVLTHLATQPGASSLIRSLAGNA